MHTSCTKKAFPFPRTATEMGGKKNHQKKEKKKKAHLARRPFHAHTPRPGIITIVHAPRVHKRRLLLRYLLSHILSLPLHRVPPPTGRGKKGCRTCSFSVVLGELIMAGWLASGHAAVWARRCSDKRSRACVRAYSRRVRGPGHCGSPRAVPSPMF